MLWKLHLALNVNFAAMLIFQLFYILIHKTMPPVYYCLRASQSHPVTCRGATMFLGMAVGLVEASWAARLCSLLSYFLGLVMGPQSLLISQHRQNPASVTSLRRFLFHCWMFSLHSPHGEILSRFLRHIQSHRLLGCLSPSVSRPLFPSPPS